MTTVPLRTVKDQFSQFIDRVQREHERVTVTRNEDQHIVEVIDVAHRADIYRT